MLDEEDVEALLQAVKMAATVKWPDGSEAGGCPYRRREPPHASGVGVSGLFRPSPAARRRFRGELFDAASVDVAVRFSAGIACGLHTADRVNNVGLALWVDRARSRTRRRVRPGRSRRPERGALPDRRSGRVPEVPPGRASGPRSSCSAPYARGGPGCRGGLGPARHLRQGEPPRRLRHPALRTGPRAGPSPRVRRGDLPRGARVLVRLRRGTEVAGALPLGAGRRRSDAPHCVGGRSFIRRLVGRRQDAGRGADRSARPQGAVHFTLVLEIAGPSQRPDDPSSSWPETLERFIAGELVLDRCRGEEFEDLRFTPWYPPVGICPDPEDHVMGARQAVYPRTHRQTSPQPPR